MPMMPEASTSAATVGTTSAQVLAANASRQSVTFHNPDASKRIALRLGSTAAVLGAAGTVTLEPGETLSAEDAEARAAWQAIASAASSPLTVVVTDAGTAL